MYESYSLIFFSSFIQATILYLAFEKLYRINIEKYKTIDVFVYAISNFIIFISIPYVYCHIIWGLFIGFYNFIISRRNKILKHFVVSVCTVFIIITIEMGYHTLIAILFNYNYLKADSEYCIFLIKLPIQFIEIVICYIGGIFTKKLPNYKYETE